MTIDLVSDAVAEATRLTAARSRTRAEDEAAFGHGDGLALEPLVARARRREARRSLAGRTLLMFRISWLDGYTRLVESRLIGVLVPMHSAWPASRDRRHFRATVMDAEASAISHVEAAAVRLDAEVAEVLGRRAAARLDRERAIAAHAARAPRSLVQTGLFDRRAERAQQRDASANTERERLLNERLRAAESAALYSKTIELVLALLP